MDDPLAAPAGPGRLGPDAYLRHLRTESARFRDVLEGVPGATRVPSCPAWDADDLLWHLGEVQWFWSEVLRTRPASPDGLDEPQRPTTRGGLLAFFDSASGALHEQLASADPEEEAWTWAEDHTVGFVLRRQAHEALVHRVDAELAAGATTALDPLLAADGVDEVLTVMYGGCPPWGRRTPTDQHVRVDCTDTDTQVWVNLVRFAGTDPSGTTHDEDDLAVVPDPGTEPDAVVEGTAGDLDRWLWHRAADDVVHVAGDPGVLALLRGVLSQPIT
ncbi:maleylpyruvate isomerase family mycothiol-dependent enzyme [Nocardioides solisilvae]|uniref:maleylpyruvate isomerase family mycothiol-dependent enzyme n=1 Tax=Nocardioides solisilvae TaxID=1542435 RepID=UPI000D74A085|nr:maleylpyruvate isomerase family mycothiol-dependent enzyme [Nocardioides solisilvae]